MPVPDLGRLPMYSTWYSFHQAVDPAEVEAECRRAAALGCRAVIIDDGWQTMDSGRGYAHCGDWRPERIGDMAGHVRRLHAMGMAVLLWYSVPYIGVKADSFARWRDTGRLLRIEERKQAGLLDPRYPEVRRFLLDTYVAALRDWDLDGLKLDFVHAMHLLPGASAEPAPGMDIVDLDQAVLALLRETRAGLTALKPDVLIEFRQSYVGPAMRTVGNLFRATDCPADGFTNRQRTLDIRALCRSTAAHADMIMWHIDDPVESAALQLLNILFAVPQISVRLDRIPAGHRAMLGFWINFWTSHRMTLLDGRLEAEHPEAGYTVVTASDADARITALYQAVPATLPADAPPLIQIVNATRVAGVLVEVERDWQGRLAICDTTGKVLREDDVRLAAGVHRLAVPPAGLLSLRR
jgi:alpha-galactosidase